MLERNRVARRVYSYYFAFKDCFVCFDAAFHGFDDFWQAFCYVCESSAENPHFTAQFVDLHSCTIILVLESRFATMIFFFNDTATTEIYTLSLHDALPI